MRYSKQGFTLVETLVAITVFTLAILGPIVIAYRGALQGQHAKDEFIASFLAQDAIEYMRYVITRSASDTRAGHTPKVLADQAREFMNACYNSNPGVTDRACTIDTAKDTSVATTDPDVAACPSVAGVPKCGNLYFNASTGKYSYDSSDTLTTFNREVRIVGVPGSGPGGDIASTTEFQLEAKVTYGRANSRRSVVIKELITEWRRPVN